MSVALLTLLSVGLLACSAPTERIRLTTPGAPSEPTAARPGTRLVGEAPSYALEAESFELYRPVSTPRPRAGLVWVGAGRSGAPPRSWVAALERHGVAWIGANDSGNRRPTADRIGLALDAADHLRAILDGPTAPLFVAGFSGGARIASELALVFPDVFDGGFFAGAADYFRALRSSDPRWQAWPAMFAPPPRDLLDRARSESRFALVVGDRDPNAALLRDVFQALQLDRFSHSRYYEIADFGHAVPPAACFETVLVGLLEPAAEAPSPRKRSGCAAE